MDKPRLVGEKVLVDEAMYASIPEVKMSVILGLLGQPGQNIVSRSNNCPMESL